MGNIRGGRSIFFRIIVFVKIKKNIYLLFSTIWGYVSYFSTFETFYFSFMWLSRILKFVFLRFVFPIILFWMIFVRIIFSFGGIIWEIVFLCEGGIGISKPYWAQKDPKSFL